MFGPKITTNTFSFGKILGGLSKTLGVVNQIIPIYKEAKPMIQNAKTAFNIVKEFGNTTTNRIVKTTEKNMKPIKEKINTVKSVNLKIEDDKFFIATAKGLIAPTVLQFGSFFIGDSKDFIRIVNPKIGEEFK